VDALVRATGLSEITIRVCISRGLTSREAIEEFLSPRLDSLTRPSAIEDLPKAVNRIGQARAAGEKLRIFGDYDVDGTTGAALLSWGFRELGIEFEARQPDRFKDGYGLNVGAVVEAAQAGARVLVTVDCGITSFDAAAKAQELGIDLIIIDHHQIDALRGLPPAYAIVNPQRADDTSGLRQLCGCGLAFYLLMALRTRGREQKWFAEGAEPNLKQHLDLVVMATAADMVPLTGDNHTLVKQGLEVLKNSKKPGVRALLEAAGVRDRELSPSHLGFVIGPRINASGRMGSASLALELLTTTDESRARELAYQLEHINKERAETQNQIWDEVRARVEQGLAEGKFKHSVVVADSGWHEGVVGIVASRVTETFRKPAAVVSLREDFGKGSVRSYGGKDVLQALRDSSETLLGFGGHKHAAGLTVALDQVEAFTAAFDRALATLMEEVESTPLMTEGACDVRDFNVKALTELEKLGPFGPGNPEPVFTFRASVKSHRVLKGRHLKLDLGAVEAIWFGAAEREELLVAATSPEESEWAGIPELNRFRGNVTPTIRVRDWRPKQV
jgi:single-stranded-DNA-specific exonuclease